MAPGTLRHFCQCRICLISTWDGKTSTSFLSDGTQGSGRCIWISTHSTLSRKMLLVLSFSHNLPVNHIRFRIVNFQHDCATYVLVFGHWKFSVPIRLFTTCWLFTLSEGWIKQSVQARTIFERCDKVAKFLLSSEIRRVLKWDLKQEVDQTPTSEIGCLDL